MTVPGDIVELELFATKGERITAVAGSAAGNWLEVLCFQELAAETAISIECQGAFAVGQVVAATSDSDGLISYHIEICEAVINPETRIHPSWKLAIK